MGRRSQTDQIPTHDEDNPPDELLDSANSEAVSDAIIDHLNRKEEKGPGGLIICRNPECETQTNKNSGLCVKCEEQLPAMKETAVMPCSTCPIKIFCIHSANSIGLCVFELKLSKADFENEDELVEEFRRLINTGRIIVRRLERQLVHCKEIDSMVIMKELRMQKDQVFQHAERFMKLMGMDKLKGDKKEKMGRVESVIAVAGKARTEISNKKNPLDPQDGKQMKPVVIDGFIEDEENMSSIEVFNENGEVESIEPIVIDTTVEEDVEELRQMMEEADDEVADLLDEEDEEEAEDIADGIEKDKRKTTKKRQGRRR